ncbi:SUR7/PalI family-domain-containing protein [Plectosphaerella cucumerina]|uniref:SUR7/PalI family-domain-containing protein n=1 Tax=Plectosphaerella cucumerina TaxID=40658 RepID=A0A8K0TC89_9PEZI|nr:SUR7/PalI family-domain-containing protein [Plectosphaerella cucumerina]
MGALNFVSHFGTFLLLVATILLVIASITAPTVKSISFMTVDLGDNAGAITFGSFGWCLTGASSGNRCSGTHIGYNPAEVISSVEGSNYSGTRAGTAKALTNVMILHPIGAGIAFIAFILSIGSSFFGSFLSSLVAGSAFIVTLVALICDWVWMSLVRNNVNDDRDGGSRVGRAHYDAALWCVLAAAICSLIASVILFFTCCAGRRNRSRAERHTRAKADYASPPATTHRRRWWSRSRY